MKLTPLDIHHKEFRRSIRGYNEEEVDVFLDQVAEEFERFFKENAELKEKVEAMQGKVKQYEGVEQTLQKALFTGQQAADQVKENALKEADIIVADAENKARELIRDVHKEKQTVVAELRLLREAETKFREQFQQMLSGFMDEVAQIKVVELPDEVEAEVGAPAEEAEAAVEPAPSEEQGSATGNVEDDPAAFDAQPTLVMEPVSSPPAELIDGPGAEAPSAPAAEFKITLGAATQTPGSASATSGPDTAAEAADDPDAQKKPKERTNVVSSFFDDDLGGD